MFVGFALMAGGLAGSVTVLVLKYLVHDYPFPTLGFGVSNVVGNALVMLRYVNPLDVLIIVLWCCGFRRMWRRMSISIICRFDGDGIASITPNADMICFTRLNVRLTTQT